VPAAVVGTTADTPTTATGREETVQVELALSLPREHRSVPVARHLVRAAMRTLGVDADCANDVEVALSEACTNVLQHGDPAADYEVGLCLDAERCRLRVIEVGRGAAGAFAQEPPGRAPDGEAEHGRGCWCCGR
jgi:serine/threonine-protein kinase RsbW